MSNTLTHLSPNSRTWIFQADRILNEKEITAIDKALGDFIPQWASHGNDLYGGFRIEENLFVVIAVDEARSPASGCSIDSLTRVIQDLGRQLSIDFFNRLAIAYENKSGKIDIVSMSDFKNMINQGEVDENTTVFNNLVNTKQDFEQNWRTAVKNSWHTNLFQIA